MDPLELAADSLGSARHILENTELDDWDFFIRQINRIELKTTHMAIKVQKRNKEIPRNRKRLQYLKRYFVLRVGGKFGW
jgi:hypothetical protein